MKIALPVDSQQGLGGGFTFQRNLTKGLKLLGHKVVTNVLEAEIALISGVTMITKETFRSLKDNGIKVVVRLDNVPRNSRNRGVGTSRLKNFSQQADQVVYQAEWARWYLRDFIGVEGEVIYNGIDLDVFKPEGKRIFDADKDNVYLYSRFNRDETKNWEVAWYKYQLIQRENPNARLVIVGKFSPEIIENDFDFFRNEKFDFFGVIEDSEQMAKVLRSCGYLLATYFNDAFSNTYLEALCTGVKLHDPDLSGGTTEMLELFKQNGREFFSLERMTQDYVRLFEEVLDK